MLLIPLLSGISCNEPTKANEKISTLEKTIQKRKIQVPKNGFFSGFLDQDGTLWFCSNGGGVYHFDGQEFENFTMDNGLSSDQVYSITADLESNIWFGTQNGLTKYDGNQFTRIALPYQDTTQGWISKVYPVLNPNAAHSLAADDDNNLWIGTGGGGAYKYDGVQFQPHLTEVGWQYEGSFQNWIPYIKKDEHGDLWFASMSNGGITQFNGRTFTHYLVDDGLSDDQVRTIYHDRSGKMWIGFNGNRNAGLTVYDGSSFKTYGIEDGLCNQRIRAICEDKNGRLWLGGDLADLCVFDGKQFSVFNFNGRTFSDVLFILNDLEDNMWFGGTNGLWKYDGDSVISMTE